MYTYVCLGVKDSCYICCLTMYTYICLCSLGQYIYLYIQEIKLTSLRVSQHEEMPSVEQEMAAVVMAVTKKTIITQVSSQHFINYEGFICNPFPLEDTCLGSRKRGQLLMMINFSFCHTVYRSIQFSLVLSKVYSYP